MNENVWSLLTTRDGITAQLTAPRYESFPADEQEAAAAERVVPETRRRTPLFRRLSAAIA